MKRLILKLYTESQDNADLSHKRIIDLTAGSLQQQSVVSKKYVMYGN
ncbi:hypothetical protein LZZ90_11220 [Flavobacterium sp. SM15]|nr:hypothetical protein [Flavobacterium sp. SM15]MCG2612078.1 hypothetical protein [Flavobacterium sp. SM15]